MTKVLKHGKMQRVVMGMLATMLVVSLVIAAVSLISSFTARVGPPSPSEPQYDCTGCGWRAGYTCYGCKDGILWEYGELWDHCFPPWGEEWYFC